MALPLSTMVFAGSVATEAAAAAGEHAAAAATGVVIGGGLITVFAGFLGFFLGAVFLVVGFLIGRDKQVVVVQAPSDGGE